MIMETIHKRWGLSEGQCVEEHLGYGDSVKNVGNDDDDDEMMTR